MKRPTLVIGMLTVMLLFGCFVLCYTGFLAEQCNKDLPECKGNCCACRMEDPSQCFDVNGVITVLYTNRCSVNLSGAPIYGRLLPPWRNE